MEATSVQDKELKKQARMGFCRSYDTYQKPHEHYSELKYVLQEHLGWHGARVTLSGHCSC